MPRRPPITLRCPRSAAVQVARARALPGRPDHLALFCPSCDARIELRVRDGRLVTKPPTRRGEVPTDHQLVA